MNISEGESFRDLMKLIGLLLLITLFISASFLPTVPAYSTIETDPSNEEFFFGVTFGGNTTDEAKLLPHSH